MSDNVTRALLDGPIGSILTPADVDEIAQLGAEKTLSQGEPLFSMGDSADALYIVLQGSLQVRLGSNDDDTPVADLQPGQLCGELEAMTRTLRVATVAAQVESAVFQLPLAELDRLLEQNRSSGTRLVQVVAKTLARRLAAVNQRLTTRANEPPPDDVDIVEVVDTEVTVIEENDLEVLDKLWS